MSRPTAETKAAVLAAYASGLSQKLAAQTYGVSESTVSGWVQRAGISRTLRDAAKARQAREEADLALTGGRWVLCPRTRVQRWVA